MFAKLPREIKFQIVDLLSPDLPTLKTLGRIDKDVDDYLNRYTVRLQIIQPQIKTSKWRFHSRNPDESTIKRLENVGISSNPARVNSLIHSTSKHDRCVADYHKIPQCDYRSVRERINRWFKEVSNKGPAIKFMEFHIYSSPFEPRCIQCDLQILFSNCSDYNLLRRIPLYIGIIKPFNYETFRKYRRFNGHSTTTVRPGNCEGFFADVSNSIEVSYDEGKKELVIDSYEKPFSIEELIALNSPLSDHDSAVQLYLARSTQRHYAILGSEVPKYYFNIRDFFNVQSLEIIGNPQLDKYYNDLKLKGNPKLKQGDASFPFWTRLFGKEYLQTASDHLEKIIESKVPGGAQDSNSDVIDKDSTSSSTTSVSDLNSLNERIKQVVEHYRQLSKENELILNYEISEGRILNPRTFESMKKRSKQRQSLLIYLINEYYMNRSTNDDIRMIRFRILHSDLENRQKRLSHANT